MRIEPFGRFIGPDGVKETATRYVHGSGRLVVGVLDYGALVQSVRVPDRDGRFAEVTLGFGSVSGYADMEARDPFFGATVGRFANRIAGGRLVVDGVPHQLSVNRPPNHLHGGVRGFGDVRWQGTPVPDGEGVVLTYVAAAGEEGYPGRLTATATFRLVGNDTLRIEYEATADAPTPVNLTNHTYWNLGGVDRDRPDETRSVLDHVLGLRCDRFLPVDDTLIPTGETAPVAGSPFDFTEPHAVGRDVAGIGDGPTGGGYDHCLLVAGWEPNAGPSLVAELVDLVSGRTMTLETDQPGLQLYTGNYLTGAANQAGFTRHRGMCLEAQHLPDSPNHPSFPNTILRPGETYRSAIVHRFGVAG